MPDGKVKLSYLTKAATRFQSAADLLLGINKINSEMKEMERHNFKPGEIEKTRREKMEKLKSEYSRAVAQEQQRRENILMAADVAHQLNISDPKLLQERQIRTDLFREGLLAMSGAELKDEAMRIQMRKDVHFRTTDEHNAFVAELRRRGLDSEADLTRAHLKANYFDQPWRLQHEQVVTEFETFSKIPEGSFPAFGPTESGEEASVAMEVDESLLSS